MRTSGQTDVTNAIDAFRNFIALLEINLHNVLGSYRLMSNVIKTGH